LPAAAGPGSDSATIAEIPPLEPRPAFADLARSSWTTAAVAIANARLYQTTATLAENMRRAMETRAVIECCRPRRQHGSVLLAVLIPGYFKTITSRK
jgi:hypothetical protein